MTFAERKKLFTTGELARAIYAHPGWDQNFRGHIGSQLPINRRKQKKWLLSQANDRRPLPFGRPVSAGRFTGRCAPVNFFDRTPKGRPNCA